MLGLTLQVIKPASRPGPPGFDSPQSAWSVVMDRLGQHLGHSRKEQNQAADAKVQAKKPKTGHR